jgi:hypothetical protein
VNQATRIFVALIGAPVELYLRAFGFKWKLDETVSFVHPEDGWTLTAHKGMLYDSFTYAPNLRRADGKKSNAAALHDKGWNTGKKDDGSMLTFDENNHAFRSVLDKEGHPELICDVYEWGVSRTFMRKKWVEKHDHI